MKSYRGVSKPAGKSSGSWPVALLTLGAFACVSAKAFSEPITALPLSTREINVGHYRIASQLAMVEQSRSVVKASNADDMRAAVPSLRLQTAMSLTAPTVPVPGPVPKALSLRELLLVIEGSYPALQSARLQARAAQEDVSTAQRLRWPTLSVAVEAARGGNETSSPSRQIRVAQTLWDFGRVDGRIAETKAQVNVSEMQAALTRQDLFLQTINAWQQLLLGLERERVASRSLSLLQGYQAQMQRRVEAQASAPIDLELVEARLLQVQAELAAARSLAQQATSRLEQLSGIRDLGARIRSIEPQVAYAQIEPMAQGLPQVDIDQVASEHPSVQRARHEYEALQKRLETKQAELLPRLYLRVDKPLDRTLQTTSTSPRFYVGLEYEPSAGFSGFAEVKSLATRLEGQALAADTAKREVTQALAADREEFLTARNRMDGLRRSVDGANTVLNSYQRQFQAARKSWLDLLNTVRDLSSSEYALAETRVTMVAAMHRLQLRMGMTPDQP